MRDIASSRSRGPTPACGVSRKRTRSCSFRSSTKRSTRAGITRKDIGFTCSASCDYLSGAPFAFVQTLEATGAWPPISESHVEMDGAWALYEAWVRLQHGDIDTALVFAAGMSTRGDMREVLVAAARSVLPDAAVGRSAFARGAASARAHRRGQGDRGRLRCDRDAHRPGGIAGRRVCRRAVTRGDLPPYADGAACVILAAGDRARELSVASGVDRRHRPPQRPALPRRA